jgi:hypothetical protein
MDVGLITNGTLLDKLPTLALRRLTWCRISVADTRLLTQTLYNTMDKAVRSAPEVDWGFSYVITNKNSIFESTTLIDYVQFAWERQFTHVRVVDDLLNLDRAVNMEHVRCNVEHYYPNAKNIMVYLSRKKYVAGCGDCRISLLRPIIGADGEIYPCCGTSSAHAEMDLALPKNMSLGHISQMEKIWKDQAYFNGDQCSRCYYDEYNQVLNSYFSDITHHNFV